MTTITNVDIDPSGISVTLDEQSPRPIDPHAFLTTFGENAFESYLIDDAEVEVLTPEKVICTVPDFPQLEVHWERLPEGGLSETGFVWYNCTRIHRVSPGTGGFEAAQEEISDSI